MAKKALNAVKRKFKKAILETHNQCGDETIVVKPESFHDLVAFMHDEAKLAFNMLVDVTVVDWLDQKDERFEVVYHFLSLTHGHRMRVKVPLPADNPLVDSLCDLYASANWGEREAYDMYGIQFKDHPDLRRILLYEEFEGHPLRKDYEKMHSQPRVDLLDVERPTSSMYNPNFGEYGPEKENR